MPLDNPRINTRSHGLLSSLFSFCLLMTIKLLAMLFYRFEIRWLSKTTVASAKNIRLLVLLNHTSLYEPLFIRIAPVHFIWQISRHFIVPGADITTERPVVGRFLTTLLPGMIPITRKRDDSWKQFLQNITDQSIVLIMPEGRMRRANGLDKYGKPMTVRNGIVDILQKQNNGEILFIYSGGLHHVQTPGQRFPKLFKPIKVNLEIIDLKSYKRALLENNPNDFTSEVLIDLNHRIQTKLPFCENQPYQSTR